MVALAASVFLVLYLFLPAFFCRFGISIFLPLRSVRRTSTQEAIISLLLVLIPFGLAVHAVHNWPIAKSWPLPINEKSDDFGREQDYRNVLSALYSEKSLTTRGECLWESSERAGRRQARFLTWYYITAFLFGCLQGALGRRHQRKRGRGTEDKVGNQLSQRWSILKTLSRWIKVGWRWILEKLIVRNVSRWPTLLKPSLLGIDRVAQVQILTTDGNLYQGIVSEQHVDADDELSGLILVSPQRRKLTPAESSMTTQRPVAPGSLKQNGWRDIPGAQLYLLADKISNLNVDHIPPPRSERVTEHLQKTLQDVPTYKVQVLPPPGL